MPANRAVKALLIAAVLFMAGCGCAARLRAGRPPVYLFRDNDGLYRFDPVTKKDELIFRDTSDDRFIATTCWQLRDTLTFNLEKSGQGNDINSIYYSINLRNKRHWISALYTYHYNKNDTRRLTEAKPDRNGVLQVLRDTTFSKNDAHAKAIDEFNFVPLIFRPDTSHVRLYDGRKGLYYASKGDTVLLAKNKAPKTTTGYNNNQLDPTGHYAYTRFHDGAYFFPSSNIQRINISTKKATILRKGEFGDMMLSPDGNYLLMSKLLDYKNGRPLKKVFVLNIKTHAMYRIGIASSACWGGLVELERY